MKDKIIKDIGKFFTRVLLLCIVLSPLFSVKTSQAQENISTNKLESDIRERFNELGGDWQVAINSLEGDKYVDLYLTSDSNQVSLPAASSIKLFIGLSTFDQIERGLLEDTSKVYNDIYDMINLSDNMAANRLIDNIGGFDTINKTIIDITGGSKTSLNRYFLQNGKENMTNARDLNMALTRIYYKDYISSDNSDYLMKAMTSTSTKNEKLLGKLNDYDWAINKSGELPDRGVENDSAIIKVGDSTFVISVLSKTKNIYNRKPQLDCIKDIGKISTDYFRRSSLENDQGESSDGIYYYKKVDLDKFYMGKIE